MLHILKDIHASSSCKLVAEFLGKNWREGGLDMRNAKHQIKAWMAVAGQTVHTHTEESVFG